MKMKHVPLTTYVGMLLGLLGAVVMLGWLFKSPTMVRVLPSFPPMVLISAFCFFLAGGALLTFGRVAARRPHITSFFGIAVAAFALVALTERVLNLELGIDWPSLHTWLSSGPNPGRMSISTAFGFLLVGVTLMLLARQHHRRLSPVLLLTILGIGATGVFGIVGYLVQAHL